MKKIFLLYFFISVVFSVSAQNTWVQKLTYNYQTWGYVDTLTGVKKVEVGADGSLYILANVTNHYSQKIFKFSPNSHHYEWDTDVGYGGSQLRTWTDHFRSTSDSGLISCRNYYDWMSVYIYGLLEKYSADGTLEWSHHFGNSQHDQNVYDVIEKHSGGYFALIEDSLYSLDNSGNVIDSTGAIAGIKFLEMTNGDLLVLTSNNVLVREDTLGNVIWSQNCTGLFAYDTASVFIQTSDSSVQKVDALTGAQLWNRSYGYSPISEIEATHDGGFIASIGNKPTGLYGFPAAPMQGVLFRADSLGDTLWTRTYPLPHFGLPTVKLMPNGNLFTGGCYLSGYAMGSMPNEYSAFCCMMNADGSYPLQQTGYVGPMDANNDHLSDFVDDALEVMVGLGQTGQARDTTIYGYPSPCERDDIAIDWTTYTSAGVNRKYSDYDGNGIIDTSDIQFCVWNNVDSFPSLYRYQNPTLTQTAEEFCLVPINDTIAPEDPALYYMVMGSNTNPVDSIYGFAFSYLLDQYGNDFADSVFSFSTNFGTEGVDLFKYHRLNVNIYYAMEFRSRTLLCRTDFQNAYGVNDTIGIVRFVVGPFPHALVPTIRRFKAILVDGTEIPFNTCMGSIFIDSTLLSVSEKEKNILKIFPNPVSDFLSLKNISPGNKKIIVFNSLGERVKEMQSSEKEIVIPVRDLTNGIFMLRVQSDQAVSNTTFVVQH